METKELFIELLNDLPAWKRMGFAPGRDDYSRKQYRRKLPSEAVMERWLIRAGYVKISEKQPARWAK